VRARVRLHASPRRRLRAGVSLPAFYRHRASGTLTCDGRVDGVLLESTPDLRQTYASPPPSTGDALVLR
jgi:hypothetical protein